MYMACDISLLYLCPWLMHMYHKFVWTKLFCICYIYGIYLHTLRYISAISMLMAYAHIPYIRTCYIYGACTVHCICYTHGAYVHIRHCKSYICICNIYALA